MLKFHVPSKHSYATIFTQLEKLQKQFKSLVQFYAASDPTLDDVFLTLVKKEK